MKVIIVKLGGAALTNKQGSCQLADDLDDLLLQIKHAHEHAIAADTHRLVLVHGAGSFGHPQAKQYGIKDGWHSSGQKRQGFSHTRQCVQKLHLAVLSRLHELNLPVLGLSPFDHLETTHGAEATPTACFQTLAGKVRQYLALGFLPVLHGDAVLDKYLGCTILSGDVIMGQLARLLQPDVLRCVFITDVDGIYDIDPKLASRRSKRRPVLIRHVHIDPSNDTEQLPRPTRTRRSSKTIDVTGGMMAKITWARQIALYADVVVCKAGSSEVLTALSSKSILPSPDQPLRTRRMTVITCASSNTDTTL